MAKNDWAPVLRPPLLWKETEGKEEKKWCPGQVKRNCHFSTETRSSVLSLDNGYLADLNGQAETMFFELVKQMAAREGVTEQLKAQDQMLWVQRMNNIRDRAMEVVNNNLIYA